MGRRKIEIKAIKDDRNRSVTFLKRKGGLFKKAHELSVLCSVDVAVIIFGNNKKLYEYSSSDINEILTRHNFYGVANEHKGPADFNGKKDLDDDDDDDLGTPQPEHRMSQDPQMMPPQYQHPGNQFQHIRHHTASASPPIPNGVFHHPQQRQHTPQPHQISRPTSRNDGPRRIGSNLAQHHSMPQVSGPPPQGANTFAYIQNPSMYNPQAPQMPPGMMQHQHPHQPPPPPPPPPPQQQQQQPPYQYPAPPPQHMQQAYVEDAQRQSMPPAFPQVERTAPIPHRSPPQPQPQASRQPVQLKQEPSTQESRQQMLEPIKRVSSRSKSIFTPIDEDRSVLSKHWHSSTTIAEPLKPDPPVNRPQSVDVAAVARNGNGALAPPPPSPPRPRQPPSHNKDRNISMSSIDFQPPSRTDSGMSQVGPNAKRPRLKVQIPDEASDNDSQTAGSINSAQGTNSSHPSRPNAGTDSSHSGGPSSTMGIMTLPPPSPSTSTIQSAGASGPPNPFARPLPPSTNNNASNSNPTQTNQTSTNGNANGIRGGSGGGGAEIETPVSALPSRFMNNEFLPSPSTFYPEWNFRAGRGSDSAGGMGMEIQSPLNFATPVVSNGPSFLRDERDKEGNGGSKRTLQSPDGEKGSTARTDEAKRAKYEV